MKLRPKWIRMTGATLMAIALLTLAAHSISAQSQGTQRTAEELQQLKERLLQLERTMQELRGQINAVEQAQRPPGDQNPPTQKTPGTIPAQPKKENSFEVYGSVMLDAGYDFKQSDPNWFDVMRPTKLPAFKDQFGPDGKTYFGVRQSRFGVKSSTPTDLGELKTQFEFELFGTGADAGQTTFRLRHAYGELGQFGAGQTWSPFMDTDLFPNAVEYWGPNGMVNFRNVQLRWTPLKGRNELVLALERPGASADGGVYADRIELQGVKPKFDTPDLSGHFRLTRSWGYLQTAGIIRRIAWRDLNREDNIDLSGSATGWGFNVSSNLKLGQRNTVKLQVVYGEGIQNYLNDATTDVAVKNNFGDRFRPVKGVALPVLSLVSFLDHNWSEHFSTSIGYSMMNIYNADAQAPNSYHQGHYALTNLLWNPVPSFMAGAEFQYGRRVNFSDGWNVNDYRLQFSFRYNFSKVFKF